MISFDILMCFSRMQHTALIKENIGQALQGFTGKYRLIPICDTIEQVLCWRDTPYAEPVLCLKKPGWFMAHWLLNAALEQMFPLPDPGNRYISVWTDDDAYDAGHFQRLEEAIEKNKNPQVAVITMRLWERCPIPRFDLTADAPHMRCCCAGFEQIYVRADLMQFYRFANHPTADGFLIEQLHKELPGFCFMPEIVINHNRW